MRQKSKPFEHFLDEFHLSQRLYRHITKTLGFPEIIQDNVEWLQQKYSDPNFTQVYVRPPRKYQSYSYNSAPAQPETLSLIEQAAKYGAIGCFKFLLINDFHIYPKTLQYAILGHNDEILQLLIEKDQVFKPEMIEISIKNFNQTVLEYMYNQLGFSDSAAFNNAIEYSNFPALFFIQAHIKPRFSPNTELQSQSMLDYLRESYPPEATASMGIDTRLVAMTNQPFQKQTQFNSAVPAVREALMFDNVPYLANISHFRSQLKVAVESKSPKVIDYIMTTFTPKPELALFYPLGAEYVRKAIDNGCLATESALVTAVNAADLKIIKLLLPLVPKHKDLIAEAIRADSPPVLELLISWGEPIPDESLFAFPDTIINGFSLMRLLLKHHGFSQEVLDNAVIIHSRSIQLVQMLMSYNANINAIHDGYTVISGYLKSETKPTTLHIRSLLSLGANPKLSGTVTPLSLAIATGNIDLVVLLIECGVEINEIDINEAFKLRDLDSKVSIVTLLLNSGARFNSFPLLCELVQNKRNGDLANFLKMGIDPNSTTSEKVTPLATAVRCNNLTAARILLDAGVSPVAYTALNNKKFTFPLFIALSLQCHDMVKLLLTKCNPNAIDMNSDTVFDAHYDTKETPDPAIMSTLLVMGADPNIDSIRTPLFLAIKHSDFGGTSKLLAAGADPNKPCFGKPPLHYIFQLKGRTITEFFNLLAEAGANLAEPGLLTQACTIKNVSIVKSLLTKGGNPNDKTTTTTAIGEALISRSTELLRTLLDAKAEVNTMSVHNNADSKHPNTKPHYLTTPLCMAITLESAEMLSMLLSYNADPNMADEHDSTPLNYAYAIRNEPLRECITGILLKAGADPTAGKELIMNQALLGIAKSDSQQGKFSPLSTYIDFLLKAGVSPNGLDGFGCDALFCAYTKQLNEDMFDKLIAAGAKFNNPTSVLPFAIKRHDTATVKNLLAAGADPNYTDISASSLSDCIQSEPIDIGILKLLLEAGANPNVLIGVAFIQTRSKIPLLLKAIQLNNTAVVDCLVKHGADPNFGNALSTAIRLNDTKSVVALLDMGATTAPSPTELFSPLEIAILFTNTNMVNMLTRRGADIKQALVGACIADDINLVKRILDLGADPNRPNAAGLYPLAGAGMTKAQSQQYGTAGSWLRSFSPLISLLVDAGADPKNPDAFCQAIEKGRIDTISQLIKLGADPNKPDKNGKLPLAYVEDQTIFDALIDAGADIAAYPDAGVNCSSVAQLASLPHETITSIALKLIRSQKMTQSELRLVFDAGVDPNAVNKAGETFLGVLLTTKTTDDSTLAQTVLWTGRQSKLGAHPLLQTLLESGANPNQPFFISARNQTCTMWDLDLPESKLKIIFQFVDLNKPDQSGVTPLAYYIARGVKSRDIEVLLNAGADPLAETKIPQKIATEKTDCTVTPLLIALMTADQKAFSLLFDKVSDIPQNVGEQITDFIVSKSTDPQFQFIVCKELMKRGITISIKSSIPKSK